MKFKKYTLKHENIMKCNEKACGLIRDFIIIIF